MFRKVCSASGSLCIAATVVKIADSKKSVEVKASVDEMAHYKCKPSELPLYTPLHAYNKGKLSEPHTKDSIVRSSLESGIRTVRVQVFKVCEIVSAQKKSAVEFIDTGKAHSKFIFDYLNEPDNTLPRIGAIGIGGLSGFIFALRGGFFKKLLYTGIGSGAIASICYPKKAEKYAQEGLVEGKKVATIAYNFVFGVKPGDEVPVINWPKIPTNVSEISDSISDLAKSAKESLFAVKK